MPPNSTGIIWKNLPPRNDGGDHMESLHQPGMVVMVYRHHSLLRMSMSLKNWRWRVVFLWGTKIPTIHLLERSDSVEENSKIVLAATPWEAMRKQGVRIPMGARARGYQPRGYPTPARLRGSILTQL